VLTRSLASCAFAASLCLFAGSAQAQETPTSVQGAKVISVAEAKALLDGKAATFVDTRAVVNYGKGHIPGAVAASYKEKSDKVPNFDPSGDSLDMSKLPADKSKAVVFYSDGPTGWKSYKATVMAVKAGYTNASYFRGGFTEWEGKGMPVEK
jgi:rhodanese-related sulfurtransferase